jgi:hypothetical protein
LSEPRSLDPEQLEDVIGVIAALERAVRPFVLRPGGITYAPVLHAIAVFLAAQAVAAGEPIEGLLDNLRMLHAECLAQTLRFKEAARAVSAS